MLGGLEDIFSKIVLTAFHSGSSTGVSNSRRGARSGPRVLKSGPQGWPAKSKGLAHGASGSQNGARGGGACRLFSGWKASCSTLLAKTGCGGCVWPPALCFGW